MLAHINRVIRIHIHQFIDNKRNDISKILFNEHEPNETMKRIQENNFYSNEFIIRIVIRARGPDDNAVQLEDNQAPRKISFVHI